MSGARYHSYAVVVFDFFGVVFDPRTGEVMVGLEEFLQQLRVAGKRCGIASSSNSATIEQFLAEHNLTDYFAVVVGADKVERTKPDPECYIAVATYFTVSPPDCVVIDDSAATLEQAKPFGFQTVYFGNNLDNFKKIATLVGL